MKKERTVTRWGRRAAAAMILLFGLVGGIAGWFKICEDQATAAGATIQLCRQPSVSDAVVLIAAVAFLVLIARDFQELGAFGFSLKNRIDEQEKRTTSVEGQLALIGLRLDASASAAATANVIFLTPDQIQRSLVGIPEKRQELLGLVANQLLEKAPEVDSSSPRGPALFEPGIRTVESMPAEEVSKRAELLTLWEQLDQLLELTPLPSTYNGGLHDAVEAGRGRFVTLFAEELNIVRAVRNAAAHSRPVERPVLDEALEMARELVRIARELA